MKINAINSYINNIYNNKLNRNIQSNNYKLSFEGSSDVFIKTSKTDEKLKSKEIKKYTKEAKKTALASSLYAKIYHKQLDKLLDWGLENELQPTWFRDLKGTRYNVTYPRGIIGLPDAINIWQCGKPVGNFTIKSYDPDEMLFETTVFKESDNSYYDISNNSLLRYVNEDLQTGTITEVVPSDTGFYQSTSQKTNSGKEILLKELYYDTKNPERSRYSELKSDGDMAKYIFDKKKKMWISV